METIAQRVEPVNQDAVSPVEKTSTPETTYATHETIEKPPSLLEVPYLAEMFSLGEAKDHFEMPSLIAEINSFVLSEFERQNLDDNAESYEEVVNHYLKKLNLPDGIDVYTRVENLVELMRIDAKLLRLAKEKEDLLKKDISELNSSQLKARIENAK